MTRIPKFRAYDGSENYMYTSEEVFVSDSIIYVVDEDGEPGSLVANNDLELMMSTGLTDKNGVEIYENDILKLDGLAGLFEVRRANSGLYKLFRRSTPYDLMKLIDWIGYVEVIGNVYENKELFE